MRISEDTYNRLLKNSINVKENKYHNKITNVNGIKFDSKKEANRYLQLKKLEQLGIISELELQKKFELQEKFISNNNENIRAINYYADFFYYDNSKKVYIAEDVKSTATKKDKVYCLKKKIFMHEYPNIFFVEM